MNAEEVRADQEGSGETDKVREARKEKIEFYQQTPSVVKMHENLIKQMLFAIGEDPEREGLLETPARVVRSWRELFGGYSMNPMEVMKTFEDGACDEIVCLRSIPFVSFCEHHMLPFEGVVHLGYLPENRIIGLSKLARIVDIFARRLQVQERLTRQITQAITHGLQPRAVGCIIEASHSCMSCRGIRKHGAVMVTSSMLGLFREEEATRNEFLRLIGK